MKKNAAKLSVVKPKKEISGKPDADASGGRIDLFRLEKEEQGWRITREEALARVRGLRAELESYRDQIEAVPFDIVAEGIPNSLDQAERKWLIDLVQTFNPLITGLYQRCTDVADRHGVGEEMDIDRQFFDLKEQAAETGFQIGVLAGTIFAGCAKERIDQFERGLQFTVQHNRRIVKE